MIYYGIHPVSESIDSPRPPERIYVQRGKQNPRIDSILAAARQRGIATETVADLDRRCGSGDHQGVAAELRQPLSKFLPDAHELGDRLLLMDSIQDPHNFGAALRVCDAFGFQDIIYHQGNSSGLTPAAVKVSAGAAFHLNLYISNLNSAVKRLHNAGYRIIALDAEGEQSIFTADFSSKFCLVIGSEGRGIRHNIRRQSDLTVSIPMAGRVSSLNVSCALTAVLAEIAGRGLRHQ